MKLSKLFLIAPALVLAACSSSKQGAMDMSSQYGGYSAQALQSRYNTVYFSFDSDKIEGQYQQLLDAHAAYLKANPGLTLLVEGNTDERGTPEYNIALGQRRADAVKAYLAEKGVTQVSTLSLGEEKPAQLGHDEAAYAKNRRAVLVY